MRADCRRLCTSWLWHRHVCRLLQTLINPKIPNPVDCRMQVVMPYRCDDLDCQHLRLMGDLGQACLWPYSHESNIGPCFAVHA